MISHEDVAGARMDSISDLTTALLRYRQSHPTTSLVMFKSDVSAAYRRLPLHALWQIKQMATIDGIRHVDRCTSFGGRGSCRSYTAFMGLVLWIAIFIKSLADLFGYIDNNFCLMLIKTFCGMSCMDVTILPNRLVYCYYGMR